MIVIIMQKVEGEDAQICSYQTDVAPRVGEKIILSYRKPILVVTDVQHLIVARPGVQVDERVGYVVYVQSLED